MSCKPLRTLRPALSLRWQILRRAISTEASPTQNVQKSFVSRNRSRIVWTAASLGSGLIVGNLVSQTIAPDALPDAGTPQDRMLIADLNQRIDRDSKIRELRSKCGIETEDHEGRWTEVVEDGTMSQDGLKASLAGYKALGVERVFWNDKDKTLLAVVWFGASVSGWPGVTHGGMIATQFMEKIGLASMLMRGHRAGAVATPEQELPADNHAKVSVSIEKIHEPEELSLSYVKPTFAEDFYTIRVKRALPLDRDPQHIVPAEPLSGKHDFESTLETLDGKVLVKAKGRIPLSSVARLEQKAFDVGGGIYDQFKRWLWPVGKSSGSA